MVGHNEDYIPLTPVLFQGASNFQCISAKSKNQDAALRFLNLVNTDKTVGNLLRHGIEGEHYKKSGGRIEQTGKSYGYDMGWQFGSVFNQDWVNTYPADIAEAYEKWNAQAVDNLLLGYTFDDSNFKNQIAALTNVVKQYSDPLVLGTVDQNQTLPTFLQALKENGVDDLLKEEQKQVDAYLSKAK
jgi:putative aldouronate transport system substrate-binding protein